MKAACCFGAVFTNTAGEDNMLLLRDRWSRQRMFSNYLRIPPWRATYCCVTVFACTTGHGNVLLRDCFVCTTGEGNVFVAWLFMRVPPVKTACSCVTILRVPPVRATCCCVTVLRVPPVKATCCYVFCFAFSIGEDGVLLSDCFCEYHW